MPSDPDTTTEGPLGLTERLADALEQVMDDISAGTMIFPGHSVCLEAWNDALEVLAEWRTVSGATP